MQQKKEDRQVTEKELEELEKQAKLHKLLFLALEELEENHRGEFPPDVLPVVIF